MEATLLAKLKEELKTEILHELAIRKTTESVWKRSKKDFEEHAFAVLRRNPEGWRVVNAIATIGRAVLGVGCVNSFTEGDVQSLKTMMQEMMDVAMRYRRNEDSERRSA